MDMTAAKAKKNLWQWWMRGSKTGGRDFLDGFTLGHWVMASGALLALVVIGHFLTVRFAVLIGALGFLSGLVVFEMVLRRKWEDNLMIDLQSVNNDYARMAREVARNRNEIAGLRKRLAEAAVAARAAEREFSGEPVEQRMIKSIVEQMSRFEAVDAVSAKPVVAPVDVKLPEMPKVQPGKEIDEREVARRLNDEQVLRLVSHAVDNDTIDLFIQPVVNLPQRKARFFELFTRIRIQPGVYLPAERYISLAFAGNMLAAVDNLLLLRALQLVRMADADDNRAYFINISPATLNDPKFMSDLVEFIAQNRLLAPRLVFELGQADLSAMSTEILPVLEGLSKLGCRFSMDQVKRIGFDYSQLAARHIRFIKVDAAGLLRDMGEAGGIARIKRLKSEMDRRGIDLIVEKIEREKQLLELLDLDVDYGQGWLFGKPELSEAA